MEDGRRTAVQDAGEAPICNVDGTPMAGDSGVDIYGDPYGAPGDWCSSSADSFDCGGGWE